MAGSIGQFSSQVVATQKEQLRSKFANLLAMKESPFMKLFTKASEKHNVSAWTAGTIGSGGVAAFRIPALLSVGGDYQAINLDGGDLGSGSLMNTAFMTVGYFANDIAYNVPFLAMQATKTDQQAMTNTMKFVMGKVFEEMALYNEIGFFQDATGILAIANGTGAPTVVGGKVTYNLEPTQFSFNRIRGQGALVDVYDAGNVQRQIGSRVAALNLSLTAPTITLSGVPGGATVANTDQIAFPGMGGTIGTSTIAAGSWRNGLYTFNTTNTSGSLLGLPYATAYELACSQVNMNNGYYTPSVIFSGAAQLRQRRDEDALSGVIAVCSMAQRASWYLQGITIANQMARPGEGLKSMDLAGQGLKYDDTFEAGDVTHHVSRYANKSRVDWLIPKNFGWVQLEDINFVQTPEGQRMFIGHNTTTGNPTAGVQFYVSNTRNLYCVDPGASVVFYGGAIPAGQ